MHRKGNKDLFYDALSVGVGCVIYGISVNVFIIAGNLIPGGATGLGIIMNQLTGLSVGFGIVLVNLPLFLLSIKKL